MTTAFRRELDRLQTTADSAAQADVQPLSNLLSRLASYNLVAVGSGASFTTACFAAALHESVTGKIAKAVTPLEAIERPSTTGTAVLLLSASGSNSDILRAFEIISQRNYELVVVLCSALESPLSQVAQKSTKVPVFEFSYPGKKDGFLATNSLISTCIYLHRAYNSWAKTDELNLPEIGNQPNWYDARTSQGKQVSAALKNDTLLVLSSGWGWPAGVDLESKFSEAALGHAVLSDFRNFAHGRHFWLAKRGANTTVATIETPDNRELSDRILATLPDGIKKIRLSTPIPGSAGTIDLLSQVLYLVEAAGTNSGINVARPGVAEFGRRLFRASAIKKPKRLSSCDLWTERKSLAIGLPKSADRKFIGVALQRFLARFVNQEISGIVSDYDGTLCDASERYTWPSQAIRDEITRLIDGGIVLGIASGRGRSVYEALRNSLPDSTWPSVIVGLHNGSEVLSLNDDLPERESPSSSELTEASKILEPIIQLFSARQRNHPHQLSITPDGPVSLSALRETISEALCRRMPNLRIVESDHSVDVLGTQATKLSVLDAVQKRIEAGSSDAAILKIGDQGHFTGNDFELLQDGLSLSVDRLSGDLETCWDLGKAAGKGVSITLEYLRALTSVDGKFIFDTSSLKN